MAWPAAYQKEAEAVVEVAELPKLKPMIPTALNAAAREDGWASLSALGSQLTRNHGVAKLGELMRKQTYLEMKEVPLGAGSTQVHGM